jgi:5-methylcytosine-specific restriction protein A
MPNLKRRREPTAHRQGRNNRAFYQSARWHKLSRQFRKANPLCKRCLDKGITEVGEVVDHTIPLEVWIQQGGDPYDYTNLQTLSKSCHSIKTKEDRKR